MKIEGKEVTTERNYLDPVTYVPAHAKGRASHADCERGVIIAVRTLPNGAIPPPSLAGKASDRSGDPDPPRSPGHPHLANLEAPLPTGSR